MAPKNGLLVTKSEGWSKTAASFLACYEASVMFCSAVWRSQPESQGYRAADRHLKHERSSTAVFSCCCYATNDVVSATIRVEVTQTLTTESSRNGDGCIHRVAARPEDPCTDVRRLQQ